MGVKELRQQLADKSQEASEVPVLKAAVDTHEAEVKALRNEMTQQHHQLALAQEAAAEAESLQNELDHLRKQFASVEEGVQDASIGGAPGNNEDKDETAENNKLRRELRGMKLVCTALEKKVQTYEERLLEHSKMMSDMKSEADAANNNTNNTGAALMNAMNMGAMNAMSALVSTASAATS